MPLLPFKCYKLRNVPQFLLPFSFLDSHLSLSRSLGVCQLKVKSLCKNHVLRALHNSFIGSFYNYILLWCIQNIYLSLDSIIAQKVIKLFGHKPISLLNHKVLIFMLVSFSTNALYALNLSNTFPFTFER